MQSEFRIGEVADRSGVSIDTVRYYERKRLLPRAPRSAGGYRLFTADAIERIHFIKQAQELGFSLSEIGILLANEGPAECRQVRDLLKLKLAEIDERLKRITKFRKSLQHYLAECKGELAKHGDKADCPVTTEIAHAGSSGS